MILNPIKVVTNNKIVIFQNYIWYFELLKLKKINVHCTKVIIKIIVIIN